MKLVCINCPRGCNLTVEEVNGQIQVSGNSCPRGETYAINEMTNPLRTVTTTVKVVSKKHTRLPVITSSPVPKDKVMDVVRALKDVEVKAPIKLNDIVLKNIIGLDVDIIASKTINE